MSRLFPLEKLVHNLKQNWKTYDDDAVQDYKLMYRNRGAQDKGIPTFGQIKGLGKHEGSRCKLIALFEQKGFGATDLNNGDDYDIISRLRYASKKTSSGSKRTSAFRALSLAYERFKTVMQIRDFSHVKYLDLGCGDGRKTEYTQDILGINKAGKTSFCVDISDWGPYSDKTKKRASFTYHEYNNDGTIPHESKSFDFITCYMVMHHVEDIKHFLSEVVRVLKPNGYIVIQEHDVLTDVDRMLVELEHTIYEIRNEHKAKQGFKPIYGDYFDWVQLDTLMREYGFVFKDMVWTGAGIIHNVQPNRAFYALYQLAE